MADKTYNIDILTGEAKQNVDSLNNSLQDSVEKAAAATEKFDNVTKVVTGVAAGFEGAQAAMNLFGVESEDVNEALLKMQSAMALTDSFKKISEGATSFFKLRSATEATSKSMSGLKKALIGTGIGLIVILIADLIANFDDLRKEMEWLDKTCTVLESVWDGLMGVFKNGKNVLKELGNTVLNALLAPIKAYLAALKGVGEALIKVFQGDFEGAKNAVVNAGKDMKKAFTDVGDAAKDLANECKTGYVEGLKAAAEETKKTTEVIKQQKEVLEDLNKVMQEYADERRRMHLTDYLNELEDLEKWYKEQVERIRKGEGDKTAAMEELNLLRRDKLKKLDEETFGEYTKLSDETYTKSSITAQDALAEVNALIAELPKTAVPAAKTTAEAFAAAAESFGPINDGIQMYGSAISDMLGSVASNFDENSEEYKALMITLTVINTLMGMAQAVSTAMELGPIAGPIMGSINAAMVLASGIAAITQMQNANESTNINSAAAGIVSNTVSAQAISSANQLTLTQTVLTDSVETESKVYVTTTDINKSQKDLNKKKTQVKF